MVLAGVLFEKATYGRHRVWEYDQPSLWVSKFWSFVTSVTTDGISLSSFSLRLLFFFFNGKARTVFFFSISLLPGPDSSKIVIATDDVRTFLSLPSLLLLIFPADRSTQTNDSSDES